MELGHWEKAIRITNITDGSQHGDRLEVGRIAVLTETVE